MSAIASYSDSLTQVRPTETNHRWFSVEDPEDDTTWLFDVTFLLSNFQCIYGDGCPSIESEPDPTETIGCCSHGAHFVDKEDRKSVAEKVRFLTKENWQFFDHAQEKGGPIKKKKSGDWVTRKADGACIFLNRADFHKGGGCALHQVALEHDERPLDWKPDVCWQVPIQLDIHKNDYGHETVFVRAWERRDWGDGGAEFHWWCTEEDKPYNSDSMVYKTSRDELIEMVGEEIYDQLAAELDKIADKLPTRQSGQPVAIKLSGDTKATL